MSSNYAVAKKVSFITIIVNLLLSIFKFFAGLISGSSAMISDAVHSASDILSTFVVLIGVKISTKDADTDHQYGHERFEAVAAFILSAMLLATAFTIGMSGVENIKLAVLGEIEAPSALALFAAVISIVVKEWMYHYTKIAAKKINSGAMLADAWHHRSDALSSVGALIGIGGAMLGFVVLDPLASIIIAVFIAKAAYDIAKDSIDKLTDRAAEPETVKQIKDIILSDSRVLNIDILQTRIHANRLYVDVEIAVDNTLTLIEAHDIAADIHNEIEEKLEIVKHCMVHVNPSI